MQLIVGTRGSKLALYNTYRFVKKVCAMFKEISVEVRIIKTEGDVDKRNIVDFQSVGVFTRALEDELTKGNIDIAVHSFKDLPLDCSPELDIVGVLERENVYDIAITKSNKKLLELGYGSVIGTSSQRRIFQLEYLYKSRGFIYKSIRGNIDTRCRRVREEEYDAIIISGASIPILNGVVFEKLEYDVMLPAPAQSAVSYQLRKKDVNLIQLMKKVCDEKAFFECKMEREVLRVLGGGCFNKVASRYFFDDKLLMVRFQKESGEVKNLSLKIDRIEKVAKFLK